MPRIKTLLLSGENNHDWKRTTPFCKALLEKAGNFSVDITFNPAETLMDPASLKQYQLIFTDYNGSDWGEVANNNFLSAISNGTGLVVLHAANNSFQDWTEYSKMIGLVFKENISGHGEFHEFEVNILDQEHPITRGQHDFRIWDELYHRTLPTGGVDFQVLAQAYSDPAKGGTGEYEPVMIALKYGKGRVFHTLLGHVWPDDYGGDYLGYQMVALENEGFQRFLLRGSEWAATGTVQDTEPQE